MEAVEGTVGLDGVAEERLVEGASRHGILRLYLCWATAAFRPTCYLGFVLWAGGEVGETRATGVGTELSGRLPGAILSGWPEPPGITSAKSTRAKQLPRS